MAYVDNVPANRRYSTIALVGALHLAAGYALVAGLAAHFIPTKDKPFIGIHLPEPKPTVTPESPPRPTDKPTETVQTPRPVETQNPFATPGPLALPTFAPGGDEGGSIGEAAFPTPSPAPSPLFVAKPARPKNNPGGWIVTNDYPQSAIRREAEGLVRYRLDVGADGRVTNCFITASSGHADLDQAACAKLIQRGRFEPASDSSGARVAGTFTGAVRWQLPVD